MRVAVVAHLDEAAVALCRQPLRDDTVHWRGPGTESAVWDDSFTDCDVVFGTIPASWIPRLHALRWLQLESVGFEYYRECTALIAQRGITVTNLQGQFAQPAAETALAGILALTRGLDSLSLASHDQQWQSLDIRPRTTLLGRSTAIVLGAGSIGRQVRRLLESFGTRVLSYALSSPLAELHSVEALDAALPDADLVVSCLPSTSGTRGLFDRERISRLSSSSVLVNVGRGDLIDESALIDALEAGALSGCVLDVTLEEPLDPENPLWTAPRTILTQHTGGGHRDELTDKAQFFLSNLSRFRSGNPLEGIVDWQLGY
jgi:phosphoglycerate dehydrogenase-like enzyme